MKCCAGTFGVLLLGIALLGCNTLGRQPQFKDAMITPTELKPGDTAVITVRVKRPHDIIRRVEGIIREDPSIKFKLHDDGVPPDEKAGDNVWSLQVDVPFQAPPGEFLLELTAFRSDGTPVPVKNDQARTVPMTVSIPVMIRNP
jgi:hypothetical protein